MEHGEPAQSGAEKSVERKSRSVLHKSAPISAPDSAGSPRKAIWDRTTETEWQDVVRRLATLRNWRIFAMRDSRDQWWGTDAGFPDLCMVRGSRVVFAELKAMRGRLSLAQRCWRERLEVPASFGLIEYYVWRPSDEDAMNEVLM